MGSTWRCAKGVGGGRACTDIRLAKFAYYRRFSSTARSPHRATSSTSSRLRTCCDQLRRLKNIQISSVIVRCRLVMCTTSLGLSRAQGIKH